MVNLNELQGIMETSALDVTVWTVIVSLVLSAFFAFLLAKLYVKYGTAFSHRQRFSSNFVLLATTTALIITVVKSSLALSLGLVGALSIVRFRAAIKEPEELSFLFLTIALGLGFGANQWMVTIVSFLVIVVVILLRHMYRAKHEETNLYLLVSGKKSKNISLTHVTDVLSRYASSVSLKRFDETDDFLEASFLVDFSSYKSLSQAKDALQELSKSLKITYLDKEGLY